MLDVFEALGVSALGDRQRLGFADTDLAENFNITLAGVVQAGSGGNDDDARAPAAA